MEYTSVNIGSHRHRFGVGLRGNGEGGIASSEETKDANESQDVSEEVKSSQSKGIVLNVEVYEPSYYTMNGIGINGKRLESLGAGDAYLILNVFPDEIANNMFNWIDNEVNWNEMMHKGGPVPRLVTLQGDVVDGMKPMYRHPADEQPELLPWTEHVSQCRDIVNNITNQQMNHALIQKYRNGKDNIAEHADKTIDMARGSCVVNFSFGASRVMILKPKPDYEMKTVQKITLPHNSVFVLGWKTNLYYTHALKQDKRMSTLKREDERRFDEQRISLTFRQIATFILPSGKLFGQGAKMKTLEEAMNDTRILSPEELTSQAKELVVAFSKENRCCQFDWDQYYGNGFDIVDLSAYDCS